MSRAEAVKALRDMTDAELDDHLRQQRRRLFDLRFQQATGQVENHRQLRLIRRDIARCLTLQEEVARGIAPPELPIAVAPVVAAPRRRRRAPEPEEREAEEPAEQELTAAVEAEPVDETEMDSDDVESDEVESDDVDADDIAAAEENTSLSETEPSPEEVDPDE